MSHLTKPSLLKRTFTTLAVVATAIASIVYVQEFAKIDPLVNMRKRNMAAPDTMGIRLGDVKFIQYRGSKRVAEGQVESVFIPSDRSRFQLTNVTQGAYTADDGKQLSFTAPSAEWNATGRVLTATNGARVWNKDIDLKTKLFRINEKDQILYIPGKVHGMFYDGNLIANNLRYDLPIKFARFGPFSWDGNVALSLQDGEPPARKQWKVSGQGGNASNAKIKGGTITWENAAATDGDIIIEADLVSLERESDILTATGKVRYFSTKANVSCEKAVVYRKEKRAVLTGAVDMLVKPRDKQTKAVVEEIPPFRPVVPKDLSEGRPEAPPAQKSAQDSQLDDDLQNAKTMRQYPTAITAARIEYWYGKGNRHAVITGSPQARQDLPGSRWRHLWAHEAMYDGEKEVLTLLSRAGKADARAQTSIGDDIIAEKVIVSTKEDEDDLEATNVKGSIFGKSDDEDGGVKPPDPLKPGTKKGGGLQGPIGTQKPPGRRT